MIDPSQVAPIVVTRGDVDLEPIIASWRLFTDVAVWDNSVMDDLAVYGRYAAIEMVAAPVVLVQDDDVLLSLEAIEGLLVSYEPGKIVANMPPEYRTRYTDSCLVGFGAIFDRDLPARAFKRFRLESRIAQSEDFTRTCDVIFTTLTPRVLVDLPFEYLPQTRAANRMYRQPGNTEERQRMLELVRKVRDRKAR